MVQFVRVLFQGVKCPDSLRVRSTIAVRAVSPTNDKASGMAVRASRKLAPKPANVDPAINRVPTRALAAPACFGKKRTLRPKHRVKVIEPLMKTTAVGIARLDSESGLSKASHAIMALPTRATTVALSISGS